MERLKTGIAAGLALATLALTPAAQAQLVKTSPITSSSPVIADPQIVAAALKSQGFPAEIGTDNDGDPKITSKAFGVAFIVNFYGCKEHRNCTDILLYAGFSGSKQDATSLNQWNLSKRYSRAYIDNEGDPCVELDIDLDKGGMSQALFADLLGTWTDTLGSFRSFVYGDNSGGSDDSGGDDSTPTPAPTASASPAVSRSGH